MADYHMQDLCREINLAAARLARELADEYTAKTPRKPRFVAGSVGPTNKTCSMSPDVNNPALRALTYDELATAYQEQMEALLEGGVDALLIETIFDSLNAKGLNPNKITVTSVLRTEDDVKRLRRRNGNASENSAHCYGTTFDISWKRFQKVEDEDGRPLQDVSSDTLKMVLSEVLRDLKKADKCYVKYELKQGCFHITTRI